MSYSNCLINCLFSLWNTSNEHPEKYATTERQIKAAMDFINAQRCWPPAKNTSPTTTTHTHAHTHGQRAECASLDTRTQRTGNDKHEARSSSCVVRLRPAAFICSCISTIGRIEIQLCLCCSLCEGAHMCECGCESIWCVCVLVCFYVGATLLLKKEKTE